MTFMAGGEAADVERAREVLDVLGRFVFHLGPAGTGSEVKLISNMCSGVYALVTAEAFAAGAALGSRRSACSRSSSTRTRRASS